MDNEGVRIRYPCPNTDTIYGVIRTLYIPLYKLYIIDEQMR